MRVSEAKELFRILTKRFFSGANVIFAHQSRTPKRNIPLVVIKPGNVKRHTFPVNSTISGRNVSYYSCRMPVQLDLFTNGTPVIHDVTNEVIAYENTAVDDLMNFVYFINSEYGVNWCNENDVSIQIEGDVQDMTGLINDTTYEYRSMVTLIFNFTQKTVGSAAVFTEASIKYPVFETNKETGEIILEPVTKKPVVKINPVTKEPTYTKVEPKITTSTTGSFVITTKQIEELAIIEPEPIQTSMGQPPQELVDNDTGYFDTVEIKEET